MGEGFDNINEERFRRTKTSRNQFYNTPAGEIERVKGITEQFSAFSQVTPAANVVLFTAPAGKTFFITSAFLNGHDTAAASNVSMFVRRGTTSLTILHAIVDLGISKNYALSFDTPIIVGSGETIELNASSATSVGSGGFIGFLEDRFY